MVDTFAHGIISYFGFGRNKKTPKKDKVKIAWLSVFFGTLPDLSSWTIYLIYNLFTGGFGRPQLGSIPDWVFTLYGISHSIIIFGLVILAVFLIKKSIPIYLWAWGLHIAIDVPTHSREFLPTPFLWPIEWYFPGISWGTPWLFYSYWSFLILWAGYIIVEDYRLRIKKGKYQKNTKKK